MDDQKSHKNFIRKMDWRVLLGTILTSVWILAGVVYLVGIVGWGDFLNLPTGDIGSFLEGAFAPLAFLWLVIGHFMQQTEISANTRAVELQELSARRQELYSQRNSYFKLQNLVMDQLGAIAGFHYVSVCGSTGTGIMSDEEYQSMRGQSASADPSLFMRKMVSLAAKYSNDKDTKGINEVFFGTEIRTRHSNNFVDTFSKLLVAAKAIDHDEMVVNALLFGSPAGMLYRIIRHLQGKERIDPISGFATVQKYAE